MNLLFSIFLFVLFSNSGVLALDLAYVSGYDSKITAWSFSKEGNMTLLSSSEGGDSPSWMCQYENYFYAVNEAVNMVSSFRMLNASGSLKLINKVPSGGKVPVFCFVHPSGNYLFVSNFGTGSVSVFTLKSDGSIGMLMVDMVVGEQAHMVASDRSGRHLLVPCRSSNYVVQLDFDVKTGSITKNNKQALLQFPAETGPRHFAFHPSERYVYFIAEISNIVVACYYDSETGLATPRQKLSTIPDTWPADNYTAAGEILISEDARFLYGSNRGENSIIIFKILSDGLLKFVGREDRGIVWPRAMSFDPSGRFLIVANRYAPKDVLSVFSIDQGTGKLKPVSSAQGPIGPTYVGFA